MAIDVIYCAKELNLLLGWNTEYVYPHIVSVTMLAYCCCWTKTEAAKYK